MCGIAGFIDKNANYDISSIARQMGDAIFTRGPDSSGIWSDKTIGVNLIHRRLAILDLSVAGHQPMESASGRYIIVFNGEIYNFKDIKQKLVARHGAINWRGHSDTEVILWAIETYGFTATLQLLEGMFAIALWDRDTQQLLLARDRIGEKPLYYGFFKGVFGFSSELKALQKHPKFESSVNRDALGQMMLHNCVPAPLSILNGIAKLTPGCYLELSYSNYIAGVLPEPISYWCLSEHLNASYAGSPDDAVNDLERLLTKSIAEQMVSDVPIGCFLSGGVDSSTIAALMQQQSATPIKTFSIGFDNPEYDEAEYAKVVAKHLGTDHTELYVSEKDALAVVQRLPIIYDEPFSDSSQIPTFLLSQLAKTQVSVSLSGDAGDELFAGYNRYLHADSLFSKARKIPNWSKPIGLKLLNLCNVKVLEQVARFTKLPATNLSDKLYKIESLLRADDFKDFYFGLTGHWLNYNDLVLGNNLKRSLWDKPIAGFNHEVNRVLFMQYLDCLGYLPDDILVKVDRAAMANSLETRVPFLNHKVVEFAFSLPNEYKIRDGISKWPLRQVLYKHVPQALIERPKRGFGVPLNKWLRGELKDWAHNLLDPVKLKQQGYFNVALVQQKWLAHLAGKENNGYYLWDVLMFQQWLEAQNNFKGI